MVNDSMNSGVVSINGLPHSSQKFHLVEPPLPKPILVRNLSSLISTLKLGDKDQNKDFAFQVLSPWLVQIVSISIDEFGRRVVLAVADLLDAESRSSIASGLVLLSLNGYRREMHQEFSSGAEFGSVWTVLSGATLPELLIQRGHEGIYSLCPRWTFPEIEPPSAEFWFEVVDERSMAGIAIKLHCLDQWTWRMKAMDSIRQYLEQKTELLVF